MSKTADRIKLLRKQKQLTQSELANIISASRMAIANYETNRNTPSLGMLSLLAEALNTTTDYLQGKTDSPVRNLSQEVLPTHPNATRVDLADKQLILSYEGQDLSDDYKQAIFAVLKTMHDGNK
ncbi:helix-turn-helix domain-containing protein [Leuconostoc citreum]|uniref:helix-turn-helix domain-containing protein n=1 Tax=Leuconostoc citreum TaxID=33964 RepID=UPI001C1FCE70|nr:helix-turn-helix transcriptional regulator [Leuconostoc citreum]MBU7451339.1 helix-turn-helix transcriptional regulator [Leuconostoc citreum]